MLSADGRSIYFTSGRNDPAVWRYTIATHAREKVPLQGYWGAWALGRSGLYYLRPDDEGAWALRPDERFLYVARVDHLAQRPDAG